MENGLSAQDAPNSNEHATPVFARIPSAHVSLTAQNSPLTAAACPAQGTTSAAPSRPTPPSNQRPNIAELSMLLLDDAHNAAARVLEQQLVAGKNRLNDGAMMQFVVKRIVTAASYAVLAAQKEARGSTSYPGADTMRRDAILDGSFQACVDAEVHDRVTYSTIQHAYEVAAPGLAEIAAPFSRGASRLGSTPLTAPKAVGCDGNVGAAKAAALAAAPTQPAISFPPDMPPDIVRKVRQCVPTACAKHLTIHVPSGDLAAVFGMDAEAGGASSAQAGTPETATGRQNTKKDQNAWHAVCIPCLVRQKKARLMQWRPDTIAGHFVGSRHDSGFNACHDAVAVACTELEDLFECVHVFTYSDDRQQPDKQQQDQGYGERNNAGEGEGGRKKKSKVAAEEEDDDGGVAAAAAAAQAGRQGRAQGGPAAHEGAGTVAEEEGAAAAAAEKGGAAAEEQEEAAARRARVAARRAALAAAANADLHLVEEGEAAVAAERQQAATAAAPAPQEPAQGHQDGPPAQEGAAAMEGVAAAAEEQDYVAALHAASDADNDLYAGEERAAAAAGPSSAGHARFLARARVAARQCDNGPPQKRPRRLSCLTRGGFSRGAAAPSSAATKPPSPIHLSEEDRNIVGQCIEKVLGAESPTMPRLMGELRAHDVGHLLCAPSARRALLKLLIEQDESRQEATNAGDDPDPIFVPPVLYPDTEGDEDDTRDETS